LAEWPRFFFVLVYIFVVSVVFYTAWKLIRGYA
jgi:hypothetical protein